MHHNITHMYHNTKATKLMMPDVYRHNLTDAEMTAKCVAEYASFLESPENDPAAFIVESVMCCGGQVLMPAGYVVRHASCAE